MTKRRHIFVAMAAVLLAGSLANSAYAKPNSRKSEQKPAVNSWLAPSFAPSSNNLPQWAQRSISASEAKSIARRQVPGGEVVDISRNGDTYRVRVIRKDGRVVDVFIDATTGRVKR